MNPARLVVLIMLMLFSYTVYLETAPAFSQSISETFMEEYENSSGSYIYKESLEPRSEFSSSIKKSSRDKKVFYKFTQEGKGNYGKYENVSWETTAEMEEHDGFLYAAYSIRIIKDKDGNVIVKHEKHFDYEKQKIYYTAADIKGNIIKKVTFPIKGKTTDNETLIYFLKAFVAHRNDKTYKSFYLISNEPSLYRINIKIIGDEVLELALGKIKAIKLRLIPDMGLLTGLSNALIPPTFIWYTQESPYTWLQYEGLETGLGSSHIVAYLTTH